MRKVRVSLVQMDVELLASANNLARICDFARREAAEGARLILFPELANTGYVEPQAPGEPIGSANGNHADYAARLHAESEPVDGPITQALSSVARECNAYVVTGLALRDPVVPGLIYNASVLIGPEGYIGSYRKIHLWHCEKLYFAPGDCLDVYPTAIGTVGMQICYDIRFPEVTRSLTLKGTEIVTSVWASFRRSDAPVSDADLFKHRAYTRSVENGVYFLSCNRAGRHGRFQFMGRSIVTAPNGTVLAASSSEDEDVIRAEIDLDAVTAYRAATGVLTDRRPLAY